MSLKYASLSALAAAIATERARPGTYRQAITDGIAAEAATIAQLETSLDPTTIDQLAASQARHAALAARLDAFDQIALANRETQILDGFCREHCEEIAALLDAERVTRSKPSKTYFQAMAEKFATVARKFFSVGHTLDELSAASLESDKIQCEADHKRYQLATSESAIVRFKNGPCWEFLNEASVAVNALDFSV